MLKETDISCYLLRQTDEKVILLLYKEQELQQQLLEADTRAFLKSYGYTQFAVEDVLDLFKRYCDNLCTTKDFPHEMGVLLGYPLEDVKGFITTGAGIFSIQAIGRFILIYSRRWICLDVLNRQKNR